MESYALSELSEISYSVKSNLFNSVRFEKMVLEQRDGTNELVYYLIVQSTTEILQESCSGLIIGRFQPLHKGHVYLFKKALELVDCLKIGVGSSQMYNQPKNPFTFEERKKFIEDAFLDEKIPSSRFEVYPIPDLFNFEKWMNSILEIVKDFEVVFTNNLWIGRLFQNRGKILKYGLKYEFIKYNGTRIRNLIRSGKSEWKSLVPVSIIPFLESWASNQ
jgi:nicotinamide-nucleotide adenylyltransferase